MPNERDKSWQTHILLFSKVSTPVLGSPRPPTPSVLGRLQRWWCWWWQRWWW